MSVSVTVKMEGLNMAGFAVRAAVSPERIEALNGRLADRLMTELKEHFLKKNNKPNKLGGERTNFWERIAQATGVASVDAAGAVVTVAEQRFRIHFYGGVIVPKLAKALTIPLIPEAHGRTVREYRQKTGRRLFSVPGRDLLFEKAEGGNASESRVNFTRAKSGGFGVKLAARSPLRAVYALRQSVTIPRDPDAIPSPAYLAAALAEHAEDFLAREKRKGGVA